MASEPSDFGRVLRELRGDARQDEVARRAGFSKSTISRLEKGATPGPTQVDSIGAALEDLGVSAAREKLKAAAGFRSQPAAALLINVNGVNWQWGKVFKIWPGQWDKVTFEFDDHYRAKTEVFLRRLNATIGIEYTMEPIAGPHPHYEYERTYLKEAYYHPWSREPWAMADEVHGGIVDEIQLLADDLEGASYEIEETTSENACDLQLFHRALSIAESESSGLIYLAGISAPAMIKELRSLAEGRLAVLLPEECLDSSAIAPDKILEITTAAGPLVHIVHDVPAGVEEKVWASDLDLLLRHMVDSKLPFMTMDQLTGDTLDDLQGLHDEAPAILPAVARAYIGTYFVGRGVFVERVENFPGHGEQHIIKINFAHPAVEAWLKQRMGSQDSSLEGDERKDQDPPPP